MTNETFEKLVSEGFELLPSRIKEKIKNVALLIEDEPSEEIRREEGLRENETLLGYYHGIPLSERGSVYGTGPTLPDVITIYRLPLLEVAGEDPERIKEEVCDTIWHEFAHHFGMDEPEVRAREREREVKFRRNAE